MKDKGKAIASPSEIAIDINVPSPPPSPPPTESRIVSGMRRRLHSSLGEEEPQLLLESAGKKSCCIFRIPDSYQEVIPKAYKPKVVSIGPYHYGENHLQMIQQHKIRFLELFIDKARNNGINEGVLYTAVSGLVEKIRKSYSEDLKKYGTELLADMMILDGCFILMLFLIASGNMKLDDDKDPIIAIPWIVLSIKKDLLLLENQVPFFLLQTLFKESNISGDLNKMAFSFFNLSISKPESFWTDLRGLEVKHLLDLIRMTFIPNLRSIGESRNISSSPDPTSLLILSTTRIRLRGIHFSLRTDTDSILDIGLEKNKLQIPLLRFDKLISSILLNCVAFEQFYANRTYDITSYVVFMGCLLNSEEDASFLTNEMGIIANHFGEEDEVSKFFKTICKDVVFNIHTSYLRNVFEGVNKYTPKSCRGILASFKHTHFASPWTFMSIFHAILVIALTTIQAFIAVLLYDPPHKKN